MKFSLTAGFGLLLALLAANCILTARAINQLRREQERIVQLQAVRVELEANVKDYVDAETGQRGYLLTGNEEYLAPYYSALKEISDSNSRLKALLAPYGQLDPLRADMETAGKEKLAELENTIQERRNKGLETALPIVATNKGEAIMEHIRRLAQQIDAEQQSTMGALLKNAEDRKMFSVAMSAGTSAILAVAICWMFLTTKRSMAERARLLAREQEANDALQKALASERAAHSEAAHANQLKDEFLAVVSHELRTPLNAITGWVSLLGEGADEAELKEGLASIDRNTRAQARLIDDLLDVSRIVSGKLRLQVAEVDLGKTAAFVIDGLRPAADARGVEVTLRITDEAMEVSGDADRLQQIVWNLVGNAIKFTPRGGSVLVSLRHEGSNVALEVRDTGQGIKPEFLPRVFDRFSQQDASTTRLQQGLGLGLSISRHLAELHGGSVTASSEGEGKGATFVLQIPVTGVHDPAEWDEPAQDAAPSQGTGEPMAGRSIKNLRVLAVDDQNDTLVLVRRVLTRAGAEVRTAASVADAMGILESWRPDLIISDIGMPEQDGYTFIRGLRNSTDSTLRKVPAIALTAFARESDRFRAIGAGFNDHVTKPVHARALIEKAAQVAGRP